ncbi:MAG: hypothetical protein JWL96_249 [Sphingomonas bacterium]|uniref:hypothetical protein n=1 Tax=Sphingomonas bacterium TaxID=1895847 RepID=UPI00260D0962|nr:hypothetical protein [Sphingomonas bacterium]MDB5708179.1 hypothetical protein [Sphingomonas bacterium]
MTVAMSDLAARLKAGTTITAEDTLAVRRIVWPDGAIDPAEAEAIFDLNAAVKSSAREWVDFFVEAMKNYVVDQQAPVGYVDEAKAAWLIQCTDSDGRVDTLGELELLVEILESATNAPDSLKSYALAQICGAVLSGTGPTRDGGALDPGSINATEVALLRRLLYAQASDGPAMISAAEADMLFALKDATLGAANAPEWQNFFVQAVGNHLMAHSDYRPLAREQAAHLDAFMNDTHVSVGGFLMRMGQSGLTGGFLQAFAARPPQVDHMAAVAADQAITPDELSWLKARIDADGGFDPLEKALIAFVSAESGQAIPLSEPSAGAPVVPVAEIGRAPASPGLVIGPRTGGGLNS